jgi:outer membrane lipoprotein carrier protein
VRGGWWKAAATFVVAAALSSAAEAAKTPDVEEVVLRLQRRYDTTGDFTADFVQTVDVPTLGQTLESKGRVLFKRPGKMRWEFLEPDKQTLVADGQTLWVHQPAQKQVLKAPFRAAFQSTTPLSFLLGVGSLARDFKPALESSSDPLALRLRLEPKQDTGLGVLVLVVDEKTYDIIGAEVTDPLGNTTKLAFTHLKRDVGLDDFPFRFVVPPGTDVVESPGRP